MAERLIPNRPDPDKHTIPAVDKDLIVYAVSLGIPNDVAFLRFHPEYAGADGGLTIQGKKRSKDFWQYAKNRNFKDDYTKFLKDWLSGKGGTDNDDDGIAEISEDKKRTTITKMLNQLVKLIGSGDLTGEDLKTYSEIMKKVGWLKDEVEQEEPPRRYLPAWCYSECQYRLFVETNIENGSIVNECDYCRTRRFAEENGWRFDPTKNLELPEELTNQNTDNGNV